MSELCFFERFCDLSAASCELRGASFARMINKDVTTVGCGETRFYDEKTGDFCQLQVCNYFPETTSSIIENQYQFTNLYPYPWNYLSQCKRTLCDTDGCEDTFTARDCEKMTFFARGTFL